MAHIIKQKVSKEVKRKHFFFCYFFCVGMIYKRTNLVVLFFIVISPTFCSFLLDMNMEINPINCHFELGQSQRFGNCQHLTGQQKQFCLESLGMWEDLMIHILSPKKNYRMKAKIAKDFRQNYENGEFSDSIIKILNRRYRMEKKAFKKISVLATFETPIDSTSE